MNTASAERADGRQFLSVREVDAPLALVWLAWSDPSQLAKWWGPDGFGHTLREFHFRPGGDWRFTLHGPDGTDDDNHIRFVDMIGQRRIILDQLEAPRFRATAGFEDMGGRTRIRIDTLFESAPTLDRGTEPTGPGNSQTLDRLVQRLLALPDENATFRLARHFAAPRPIVWKAWTEAEQMKRWWGPAGVSIPTATMDLRPGGTYHYDMAMPDGQHWWGKWLIRTVEAPARLVVVNCFSDAAGGITRHPMAAHWPLEVLSTFTFTEEEGGVLFALTWEPLGASTLEMQTFAAAHSGMTAGWGGTLDQLTRYLAQGL